MVTTVKILWQMMEGQRLRYGWALFALILSVVLSYFVPLVGQAVIDHILASDTSGGPPLMLSLLGGPDFLSDHLWLAAVVMIGLTALSGFFSYLKTGGTTRASDSIARNLKDQLFDHLQHLPTAYHDRAETGDLVQRCTSDVETIRIFFAGQVVELGHAATLLLTLIPVMLYLNVGMTAVSFLLIPPIFIFALFFFLKIRTNFRAVDEAEGRMTAVIQENLTGMRVVKAFARQKYEQEKLATPNREYRDTSRKLTRLMAVYWTSSDLLCLAQNGLVLMVGIHWIAAGSLTVGTLFAFLIYLNMVLWPLRQLGRLLTDLGKASVSLSRVREILLEPREGDDTLECKSPAIRGAIQVRDLVFRHGSSPVLNGISFDVEPGETVAILGPSGAGKSTLVKLLLRLYDSDSGSIRLDGKDVREFDRKTVRRQIGTVMQEPFLFSTTLRENIRLGSMEASDEEIFSAARMAAIHETIASFHHGYDTPVGERGVTLSGGQRQRVALARAILRDPPVLVLDDAFSAVDGETENLILNALRDRHGRKTTLLIAHRLSTLAHADKVIVLDQGRILQSGTHEQLSREDGLYRRLWQIQNEVEDEFQGRGRPAVPFHPHADSARSPGRESSSS